MWQNRLGIATSVARDENFSWQVTLQRARKANIRHVQFYIKKTTGLAEALQNLISGSSQIFPYFHLPPSEDEGQISEILTTLSRYFPRRFVVIQHQPFWETLHTMQGAFPAMIIAVENDAPKQTPHDFLRFAEKTFTSKSFWAVVDVARFYHQAPPLLTDRALEKQILDLFVFLQEKSIPFLIHAIDIKNRQPQRENWCPLFDGRIPWHNFLKALRKSSDLLKSFLFEYENWNMCLSSIRRLREEIG